MELKAICRVTVQSQAVNQPTLIYNLEDGFTWLKDVNNEANTWAGFFETAVGAEISAREAGLDPQAIVYMGVRRPTRRLGSASV